MPRASRWTVGFVLTASSNLACAHSETTGSGLLAGLLHPITGPDHFLAMLAVGIVSVLLSGAYIWRVPAAFVGAMLLGAAFGFRGAS